LKHSLWARLLIANLVLLPLFLGATGYYLDRGFRLSLDSAARERLQIQVLTLLAEVEYEDTLFMPGELLESRFNIANSGLIGLISKPTGDVIWESPSALNFDPAASAGEVKDLSTGQQYFSIDEELYHFAWAILWQLESGAEIPLIFNVLETTQPAGAQLESYRRSLVFWLGGAAIALLLGQLLVLYWGLRPLRNLADDIAGIESGNKKELTGPYPQEVRALTRNLNSLLGSEKKRRERTRNTLADLAHSLKTPLSVIRSADSSEPDYSVLVSEQADRMEQIIGYQLQRASGGTHNLLQLIPIEASVLRLRDSLIKVYADKPLQFELNLPEDARFRGDERDLMELLGNLMDNACKYGASKVRISALTANNGLELSVEDDGPGIPAQLREDILARGARADSSSTGQGIGLAVAADIASSCNGIIEIGESELGGTKATASFR
jgi:two-component system, OmpR family, sensor histidine kinase PhoQ